MPAEIKGLNEECGVFGVWGHVDAAKLPIMRCIVFSTAVRKVQALLSRMAKTLKGAKGEGLVTEVFSSGCN